MTSGPWGEEQAAAFLRNKGWKITARNYRTRYGELDIIAENEKYLLFVEVKTRKNDHFALAREYVTPKKQARLRITAEYWLQENPTELQIRFDVIEVYGTPGGRAEIVHIEDAF